MAPVRTRRALLWVIAVSLAVIAAASAALLWLRVEEESAFEVTGEEPPPAAEPESPLAELATAIGFDEDDCGRDMLYAATGGITGNAEGESPVESPRAPFSLKFKDEVSPYSLISTFVLPGETLEVEAVFTDQPIALEASAEEGELERLGPDRWRWTAPEETGGVHCLAVREVGSAHSTCLNAFVMVPYAGEEEVNGYRVGRYQPTALRGQPTYERPRGLVEVTRETLGTWVSPHFRLAQFVGKQESDYPKYLVLRTRLLLKLETVLEELRERGIDADTLFVMSGYRTPFYNAAIGNTTTYSRHSYGDAADVFVDLDDDGRMDDINGDGKADLGDALLIYGMVEELSKDTWFQPFEGGLGIYPPNPRFGPMVHMDTRGEKARWKG